ncbi:MAG TPA: cation-translocating P-type ATPase [Candidatus Nanoarchaeia archaeon]|nr:cation-translocating P-type ATPase [Candidatus Nanoarchaeia archaeon]
MVARVDRAVYSMEIPEIFRLFDTSEMGLSPEKVTLLRSQFGSNELKKEKEGSLISLFLSQFKDFLIVILLVATAISLILKEIIDAIAIIAIVLLAVILGFYQEYNAEKAIESLKKISAPVAKVMRSGKEQKIPASDLVPGDILVLEAGDIVPADCRIIEAFSLKIDEASLTGESVPVEKTAKSLKNNLRVADQLNMAFLSTIITYGKGKAIVTNTGMLTELGKIAKSLKAAKETQTPLQRKYRQMAQQIGYAVLLLVFIVFIAAGLRGGSQLGELFLFSLSLAVAAVPSSLPAIVTIGLSLGTRILAKKNMIIKRLPAAESLGSVTIICSDKTGTLTKNEMTITNLFFNDSTIEISGSGYEPQGSFTRSGKKVSSEELELPLRIGYLCNSAQLVYEKKWEIIGDPTEGSLIVLARKGNLSLKNYSKVFELPFDSERKCMSVVYTHAKRMEAYVKGAPDLLLDSCSKIIIKGKVRNLTAKDKSTILSMNKSYAGNALRVLALAYKPVTSKRFTLDSIERDLIFVGLVGMIDPPRLEVKDAVAQCKSAGIQVMVITGDYPLTAQAIAQEIGLFEKGDLVLHGDDIDAMSDEELTRKINQVRIISRALPIQKSRIVDALQRSGHIVAMTGDGVNDAPALKKADVGIAMGVTGTDVAKEVSKATLVDDNFATIVNAVGEGRNIYDKIIKSTQYLLSCNSGEIVTVFISILLNFPLPLMPLQILLMNILTDGLPALGLGVEPSDPDVMSRKPRNPAEKPITSHMIAIILTFGLTMAIGTLYLFNQYYRDDLRLAQTIAFTTLVMFEMFAVFGSRSLRAFAKLNPFSNIWLLGAVLSSVLIQCAVIYLQPLQPIFGTVPLALSHWIEILVVSGIGFFVMEFSKLFVHKLHPIR